MPRTTIPTAPVSHYARSIQTTVRMRELIKTLANMTTPMDGLVNRDSMHADMVLAERSDEQLCSDADALYRVIEIAREILDGER